MKIRNGFVSNSSSSSFVCDITGHADSGYDISAEDLGFIEFACGHIIDKDLVPPDKYQRISKEDVLKYIKFTYMDYEQDFYDMILQMSDKEFEKWKNTKDAEYLLKEINYVKPASMCPICNFKRAAPKDMYRYLLKELYNGDESKLLEQVKEKFENYENFQKYLNL